jgi:hypothetical protein
MEYKTKRSRQSYVGVLNAALSLTRLKQRCTSRADLVKLPRQPKVTGSVITHACAKS